MSTQFALDLRVARRKAGFTQRDIAHLLDVHQSHVSDLEQGRWRPDLREIVTLSLIYGRSFESLFAEVMQESRERLVKRLERMPTDTRRFIGTQNREASITRLRRRLEADLARGGP